MRSIKLVIGFIGTRFEGWQSQKKGKTLQELFERTLSRILKEKIQVTSSSRTDSGVHAKALVAHFRTSSALHDERIQKALNFYLPRDVVVYQAKTVTAKFHARFSAVSKIYRYSIWNSPTRPLFEEATVLWLPQKLDLAAMKRAAPHIKGRHDFSSFVDQDPGNPDRSKVRSIKKIHIQRKDCRIDITVEGDGFLRHMVRIIAGTLIEVGKGRLTPSSIPKIIAAQDRRQAGPTAKAKGLTLLRVRY